MSALFLLLLILSLVALIIGLVKPQDFERYFKAWATRGRLSAIFAAAIIVFFILFRATADIQPTPASSTDTVTQVPPVAAAKTPEQNLEDTIKSIADAGDFTYKEIGNEKADPDRPVGSRLLTIKVNVDSFFSKEWLLRHTSEMAAEIFQETFAADLNASDVHVWYYGDTTDRYGNQKNDLIIVYAIDAATFAKINWSNFDAGNLCDFLQSEEKIVGVGQGLACNILANIQ